MQSSNPPPPSPTSLKKPPAQVQFTGLRQSLLGQHDSQAEKDATRLFQSFTVEEIRTKESQTRKEIEDKKQELRRLVGTRYRDLIDSADSIIHMKQLSSELTDKITKMEKYCNAVLKRRRDSVLSLPKQEISTQSETEIEIRRKKYFLGKQIKFLVDTPEQIWSSLENNNYLKAATLYLEAENVHSKLRKANDAYSSKILASIPLLYRQWAIIMQFPPKILSSSKSYLLSNGLSDREYAGALCSIVLLEKASISTVFQQFLASRQTAIHNILTEILRNKSESSLSLVMSHLSTVVDIVQSTLYNVRTLFTDSNGNPSLVQTLLKAVLDDSNNTIDKSNVDTSKLPIEKIQKDTFQWLKKSADSMKERGKDLLSKIVHGKDLKSVEEALLNAITKPYQPPSDDKLTEEELKARSIAWKESSMIMLGDHIPLWSTCFQDMFLQRAKDIILMSFQKLTINAQLDQYLNQFSVENMMSNQDHSIGNFVWSSNDDDKIEVTKKKSSGLTSKLHSIISLIDSQLENFMNDIDHLLKNSEKPTLSRSSSFLSRSSSFDSSTNLLSDGESLSSEIPKLRLFLQETCYNSVSSISKEIEKRLLRFQIELNGMEKTGNNLNGFDNIDLARLNPKVCGVLDRALFLGRIARAIYRQSGHLKKILFDLVDSNKGSDKAKEMLFPPLKRRSFMRQEKKEEPSEFFKKLQEELHKQYLFAHVMWICWLVKEFGSLLQSSIVKDNWNSSNLRKKTWEEITLLVDSDDNKAAEEKIYLPFQPSYYVMSFLFSVCKEIHRVGSHTLDRVLLQHLVFELSESVMSIYSAFLSEKKQKDKEGIIQLVFDLKFTFDILSGRKDVESLKEQKELKDALLLLKGNHTSFALKNKGTQDELEAVIQWTSKVSKLIESVEAELDPIDVAFYRPHLKQANQKCYKRTSVLFGFLVQLNRLYTEVKQKPSHQEQHNVLAAAPLASRFALLPITAPPLKTGETMETFSNPTSSVSTSSISMNYTGPKSSLY